MTSVRSRIVSLLRPDYPEPVSEDHYRLAMKVRIGVLAFLAAMNILGLLLLSPDNPEYDRHLYSLFLVANLPGHAIAIVLNAWALRGTHREPTYHTVAGISCVCELWTATTGLYLTGSVTSNVNVMWFFISIGVYRIYYDAALGQLAFVTGVLMQGGLVVLEAFGVLQSGSVSMEPQHMSNARMFGLFGWHVAAYGVAFVLSSVVARRNAELREVRKRLARVMGGADRGRLQGALLADRYELDTLLGRGGMGEVYAARRRDDSAQLAVKILHPFHTDDPDMLQRFRREAAIAERVSGGHVPGVIDLGTTEEGQHFIVMERLHGEDLETLLARRGRLPPDEAARLVTGIAAALDALHDAGAVHRDLKPSNVFLDEAGRVRLLDFGIAKFQDEAAQLTRTVAIMGTAGFMAPESARGGARNIGPAADVFALGAMAYLMLTGERPFPAREIASFIYEVLHQEPEPVRGHAPELPPDVEHVMTLALAKEPTQRYQRAGELAADLTSALEGNLPAATRKRAARLAALMYGDTHASSGNSDDAV